MPVTVPVDAQPPQPQVDDLAPATSTDVPWSAHADSWTELPVPLLKHMPPRYYKWRWRLLQPLQRRLLWGRFSLGSTLTVLLLLAATAGYCAATWSDVSGSGNPPAIHLLLAWTLAAHSSIWTLVAGLSFERAIGWHQLVVWLAVGSGVYHGIVAERDWWKPQAGAAAGPGSSTQGDRQHLVTGWVLFGLICGMVLTSLSPIRRRLFNTFYCIHVGLSLVIIVVGVIHSAALILGGVALWALDVLFRWFYTARRVSPKQALIRRLDANVVRVTFPKPQNFSYSGGQYVFLQVPQISRWEWHPFSLSSHPQSDEVMLHVRVLGDWTRKLWERAAGPDDAATLQLAKPVEVRVHIDGPYGSPQLDLSSPRYQLFLLVSGGIGITPMQSLANDLLAQHRQGRPLKKVWFVWSVRDSAMVGHFMEGHRGQAGKPASARLPRSFVPDLVEADLEQAQPLPEQAPPADSASSAAILQAQYHLTQVRKQAEFHEAGIQPGQQPSLTFGRPNLPELFDKIRAVAESYGDARVATLVCGPAGMIREVQRLSVAKSNRAVRFDCHAEIFNL